MKPLVRWIVGDIHDLGFVVLRHSVRQFRRLYGDVFRYAVFYNHLTADRTKQLESLGCQLVDQSSYVDSLPVPPPGRIGGPAWKLYPPRWSPSSHEVIIDNDLVLLSRPRLLDEFLERFDLSLATKPVCRNFGAFDSRVRPGFLLNSGLLGFPPGLPWGDLLKSQIDNSAFGGWAGHFDEQGLVATVFQTLLHETLDIGVSWSKLRYERSSIGLHFVGVNQGDRKHWQIYCDEGIKL